MSTGPTAGLRLEMRGIRKSFGAQAALDGVSLSVRAGEVHALVGENGAGKSTLMKVLSGAHQPDAGEMILDGSRYAPANPHQARRLGVGMIYQELSIAPHLSVAENIFLGIELSAGLLLNRSRQRHRAAAILQSLGHASIDVDAPAGGLSISQQQIIEIARSLELGCKVVVFDEPTSSLAPKDVDKLFTLIDGLAARGLSIIYISHFLEEVRRLSQHLTVLRDGRSITTYATAEVSDAQVVTDMVGRSVSELYPRTRHQPGAVILEVKIPERGNLSLRRGEVIGLCGLVGAGRTEFLRAVFGLDESPGSQIRLGATTLAGNPYASWRHGAGFVSENRKEEGLASALSIGDNICLPSLAKLGRAGLISPAARDTHTIRWIDELGLHCRGPAQPIGRLSGGNQQKAAFARLLEADCDILLLDEPTRGIDIAAKAKIYEVIDRLVTDPLRPRAVVMVSSYLPELLGVCDRIAVVRRGQLGPFREIADLDSESLMREATLA